MNITVRVQTGEARDDLTTFQVYKRQLHEMKIIGGKNETYRDILDRLLQTYRATSSTRRVLPAE